MSLEVGQGDVSAGALDTHVFKQTFSSSGPMIKVPVESKGVFKIVYTFNESSCMHHGHVPLSLRKDLGILDFICNMNTC